MNLFGSSAVDGSGKLVRNVGIAGAIVLAAAVASVTLLDRAARDGTLASLGQLTSFSSDPARHMANIPRAATPSGGVRYGNVDYLPTASIPGQKPRIKNVLSDPTLGLPN